METKRRPTICFATMCKNEEHCIRLTLESVADHIDTWVVCDTGSTDRTCEIVREFFAERGIPGELFVDEWVAFDKNKTLMMERARGRADYILHTDADDQIVGPFTFNNEDVGYDAYYVPVRRGGLEWKATLVYDGRLRWKLAGTAHTIIKTLDKPDYTVGDLSKYGFYLNGEGIGSRALDPKKYFYDAERLVKQFWDTLVDDPDGLNGRSVFYAGQSYMDYGMNREALQWYRLFLKLKDQWQEEVFEAQMRVARLLMRLDRSPDEVIAEMTKAVTIYSDRAEPGYFAGLYLNSVQRHEDAYAFLKLAKLADLSRVKQKYVLFVNDFCYGKHLNDELAVACYWTDRIDEGIELVNEIIDDPDFADRRPRLLDNLKHLEDKRAARAG